MPSPPSVAIIGTGFGGLCMAIQLQAAGIHAFTLYEKADRVGGVWRDNTYPGAACDVPSHLYSYSFERKPDWSRKFAPQAEILAYLEHCARKYGLLGRIRFGTEIAGAAFDERAGQWELTTTTGETARADLLVSACGQLNRPAYPRVPGLDAFAGTQFHSARWDHRHELAGRRVGVIGTGASAIQFVPEIAARVARLSLFQRTPPYVFPKADRAYSAAELALFARVPAIQDASRQAQYLTLEAHLLAFTSAQRLLTLARRQFERELAAQVRDPALRAKLTPDYPPGCKRVLISNDWYPSLTRANVELVTDAIERVVPEGVVTADGRTHALDTLIHGTGFTASDFLAPMRLTGLGGRELNDAWRDGAEAYLGLTVSGFPNLFLLYGPNTNLGHNSIVYMLESQVHYVMQAIAALQRRRLRWLDVRPEVQRAFAARTQARLEASVWNAGCTSWYRNAAGKHTNNWPGFTFEYRRATRRLRAEDYRMEPA